MEYETVVKLTMEDIAELLADATEGELKAEHMVDFSPSLDEDDTYIALYRGKT